MENNLPPTDVNPDITSFYKTELVDAANAPPGMIYMKAYCSHGLPSDSYPGLLGHCDHYLTQADTGDGLRFTVMSSWRTTGQGDEIFSTILKEYCNAHEAYWDGAYPHRSACKSGTFTYCGYTESQGNTRPECDRYYEGYFYANPVMNFDRAGIQPGTYTITPTISRTDYSSSLSNPPLVPIYTCAVTDQTYEGGSFRAANELVEVRSGYVTVIEYNMRAGYSPIDAYGGIRAGDLVCKMWKWTVTHVPIADLLGAGYTPLPDVRTTSASPSTLDSKTPLPTVSTSGYNVALAAASSASVVVGVFIGVQGLLSVIFARRLRREDPEEPAKTPLTAK